MSKLGPIAGLIMGLLCGTSFAQESSGASTESIPPNVIVIVVDDLRWDELGFAAHPFLETPNIDRLAREGALFTSAFHAVPLCSPNRASILTGQYPSRHGIIDNVSRSLASHQLNTFPRALQTEGYETAFIGKWHMGNDPTPRRGFDHWVALPGQGRSTDPELYEDGALHVVEGYTTDVLTDRAISFIEQDRESPFFVYLGHKAIHPDIRQLEDGSVDLSTPARYVPAPRHIGRYREAVMPKRQNVVDSPSDLIGKPALRRALQLKYAPPMSDAFGSAMFDYRPSQDIVRSRAEMLLAVDDGLGQMLDTLERLDLLDTTVIVFTSDNGYWYGEHGLSNERRLPYEEAIRMPLLIRYPPLFRSGAEIAGLVSSVDIAPTVLELAGAHIGSHVQGRSVIPLLDGMDDDWREAVLIEFHTYENPMPWLVDMDYRAVRTERFKYIHWMQHADDNELYDLVDDPFEMRNLISESAYADTVVAMRRILAREAVAALGLEAPSPD